MRNKCRRWALTLVLLAALGAGGATAEKKGEGDVRVYVANLIYGAKTLWVKCPGAEAVSVPSGKVFACLTPTPTALKLGLTEEASASLDPTVEKDFTITDGAATLLGARETMICLAPDREAYFVYVWHAKGKAR